MKALFSVGTRVPLSRVTREHRTALLPLGIVLAVNVVLLIFVVWPLSQRVSTNERRAAEAETQLLAAEREFKQAEEARTGKARATTDLESFYKDVLPPGVSAARRMIDLQLQQKARAHGVRWQRQTMNEEELRDSSLGRLAASVTLLGQWDDIRAFIYELERSPDFVVIDNIVLAEGLDSNDPLTLSLEISTYYRNTAARAVDQGADGR